jgi:hypothetical protein
MWKDNFALSEYKKILQKECVAHTIWPSLKNQDLNIWNKYIFKHVVFNSNFMSNYLIQRKYFSTDWWFELILTVHHIFSFCYISSCMKYYCITTGLQEIFFYDVSWLWTFRFTSRMWVQIKMFLYCKRGKQMSCL